MKGWKKALLWSAAIIIVLGGIGTLAANVAVDYFLKAMVYGGLEEELWNSILEDDGAGNVSQTDDHQADGARVNSGGGGGADVNPGTSGTAQPSAVGTLESVNGGTAGSAHDGTEPSASPSGNRSSNMPESSGRNAAEKDTFTYTPEISADKAQAIGEKITIKEKAQVTSILIGNFSAEDLSYLSELAKGGLTVQEKRDAKKLFMEKLSEKEYNTLIGIAAKYGLSQGKTYAENTKRQK